MPDPAPAPRSGPVPGAPAHPGPAGLGGAARCLVMGVVNVTPDSFSDGGRWLDHGDAVAQGLRLVADGADLVDVGGESTRPGAPRVPLDEELRRVVPVVRALTAEGVRVSVDTMRAEVAVRAVEAGAVLVNDVSGGAADTAMAGAVAALQVPYLVMHWRAHSATMDERSHYDDVVKEVREELLARVDRAVDAGVDPGLVVLDPGLGFSKRAEHNWALLAALESFVDLGFPLLVGASRKRFLGVLDPRGEGAHEPTSRDAATAAVTALSARAGAWAVRVHDVAPSVAAVRVAAAWRGAVGRTGTPWRPDQAMMDS